MDAVELDPTRPSPLMGDYRMALVAAVNVDLPNQHPTVVLRETESPRRQLSFSIGFQDAVGLTHAMRRIPTPRPLTHELMSQVLQGFDIDVVAVRLVGRQGAIYFAELDLRGRTRPVRPLVPALRRAHRGPPPAGERAHPHRPPAARGGRRRDAARARRPTLHLRVGPEPTSRHPPLSSRSRRSSLFSHWAWSAASAAAPPSSEMRMSRAIST